MAFTKRVKKELLFDAVLFTVGMSFISLFYKENLLLTALLIATWATGVKFWHTRHDIYFFVTGAIVGPLAEILCINFGAWQYTNPTFLGIPVWLPFAWGLATMLIKHIAETFVKIEMR